MAQLPPPPMAMDGGFGDPNRASMAPSMAPYSDDPAFGQQAVGWRRFVDPGMAGLGALASFIGLITQVVVVAQGVQGYLSKDQVNKASDNKTKTKTVSPDNDLLGRRALAALIKRQSQGSKPSADSIIQYYVPGTDIPTRAGAVGFVAFSHILTALLFASMLWIQWKLYRRQPPSFLGEARWTASFIAGFQCYVAFDLLGRNISQLAQAGAYLLFILSLVNVGYSVQKASHSPSAQQPYRDSMYDPNMQPPMDGDMLPPENGFGAEEDGMPIDEKAPEDQEEQLADPNTEKPRKRHRSRTVSTIASSSAASAYSNGTRGDDVDSYYMRSPTVRGAAAPRPPARVAFAESARPLASSPVTLYGPLEQQRRVEQARRSRRMSLTAPAIGEITPQHGHQAGNGFLTRSQDPMTSMIPEEDEENATAAMALPAHRVSRDGFAHRAQEWKKLQRLA